MAAARLTFIATELIISLEYVLLHASNWSSHYSTLAIIVRLDISELSPSSLPALSSHIITVCVIVRSVITELI